MIVPVRVVYGKASLLTYALLDSGATGSAISWKLVEKLNVTVKTQNMTISTYGYKGTAPRSLVNVCVEPLDGSFSIDLKNTLVGDILTILSLTLLMSFLSVSVTKQKEGQTLDARCCL